MFVIRILNKWKPKKCYLPFPQSPFFPRFKSNQSPDESDKNKSEQSLGDMSSKYQVFRDQDSEIILDIYEERNKYAGLLEQEQDEVTDPLDGINLARGLDGVYDIEDLVEVLQRENAKDIFVVAVPKEIKYVDYICVVTGKSRKHMQAIAQFVRKIYKRKMHETDIIPKLEGQNSTSWMALDLGNIALHIFSQEARLLYDLDSLWSIGPQYDKEYNKQDPVAEMIEKHSLYL